MPKINTFSQLTPNQNTSPTKPKPALPKVPKVTRNKFQSKNEKRVKRKQQCPSLGPGKFITLKKSKKGANPKTKTGETSEVNQSRIAIDLKKKKQENGKKKNGHFEKEGNGSTSPSVGAIKLHINLGSLTSTTLVSDNSTLHGASNQPYVPKRKSENLECNAKVKKVKKKESEKSTKRLTLKSVSQTKRGKRSKGSIQDRSKMQILCQEEIKAVESDLRVSGMTIKLTPGAKPLQATVDRLNERLSPTESQSSSDDSEIVQPPSDENMTFPCDKQRQIPPDENRDIVEFGSVSKGQQVVQNETVNIKDNVGLNVTQGSIDQTDLCSNSYSQLSNEHVSSHVFKSSGWAHHTKSDSAFKKTHAFDHQSGFKQKTKTSYSVTSGAEGADIFVAQHKSLSEAAIHENGIKKQRVENAIGLVLAKKEKDLLKENVS